MLSALGKLGLLTGQEDLQAQEDLRLQWMQLPWFVLCYSGRVCLLGGLNGLA